MAANLVTRGLGHLILGTGPEPALLVTAGLGQIDVLIITAGPGAQFCVDAGVFQFLVDSGIFAWLVVASNFQLQMAPAKMSIFCPNPSDPRFTVPVRTVRFCVPAGEPSSPGGAPIMASDIQVVSQDPDALLFYEVDWSKWLTARGFLEDGSEITSVTFTVAAPALKTHEELVGTVGRVWMNNVPIKDTVLVVCTIVMPEPSPATGVVTDNFSFRVKGLEK